MKCEGFGCEEKASDGTLVLGCDTVYAVNKEHFSHNWQAINAASELIAILRSYALPNAVDVVLTGGEPLIYANEPIFVEFLEALVADGHRITFETNGSLGVDFESHGVYKECVFALSVKLANSSEPFSKRVRGEVISTIVANAKDAFFKFSIDAASINAALEEEIQNIAAFAPKTQLYCMPLGGDKKSVESNTEPLIEFCKRKGYNFSDRLHIRIWDKNKGV